MRFPCRCAGAPRSRGSRWSLSVVLLLVSACAAPGPRTAPRDGAVPRAVSATTILAEPAGDPAQELELLARHRTIPARLRAAFLELRLGEPAAAIDATAEVLYGPVRPSANEEAFARYLRALAYARKGTPGYGNYDLERARALALDPELQRRLREIAPATEAPDPVSLADLAVQPRSAWRAAAPNRRDLEPMGRPTRLTIHHSAVYFRDTKTATSAAQIQRIQRDHMQSSGWADIGYHYLIDPAGRVWQGREVRWQGAHAEGRNNVGNIGICVLGNFVRGRTGQAPSRAQVAALRALVQDLLQRYDFGADAIYCHRDFKPTECPGPLLQPAVVQLARELGQRGPARVAHGQP